jgi:hypothetical protein
MSSAPADRRHACVTGSVKSPPGGDTDSSSVNEPIFPSSVSVPEILGHRHRGVDRRFARRYRHVRGVDDDDGAVHQRPAGGGIAERRELLDHLGHLVAALAAADVDDDVDVAVLGDRLLQ